MRAKRNQKNQTTEIEFHEQNSLSTVRINKLEFKDSTINSLIKSFFAKQFQSKLATVNEIKDQIKTLTTKLMQTEIFNTVTPIFNYVESPSKTIGQAKSYDINLNCVEKSHFFFSFQHMIEPQQGAILSLKSGYRNFLRILDIWRLDYSKKLNDSKKYDLNFSLNIPLIYFKSPSIFSSGYQYGERQLNKTIFETYDQQYLKLTDSSNRYYISLENALRVNAFQLQLFKTNIKQNLNLIGDELLPTQKRALKFGSNIWNSVKTYKKSHVRSGNEGNFNVELATGYAYFAKVDMFWRNYLSFKWIKSWNLKIYSLMQNFGLENSLYLAALKKFGKNYISVNDKIFLMNDVRGFSQFNAIKDQSLGSTAAVKASTKFIIYDFPFLKSNSSLLPFFFANAFYENTKQDKENFPVEKKDRWNCMKQLLYQVRAVCGIGISFDIGPRAKLELLFNFAHFALENDVTKTYQFRFSIDD